MDQRKFFKYSLGGAALAAWGGLASAEAYSYFKELLIAIHG